MFPIGLNDLQDKLHLLMDLAGEQEIYQDLLYEAVFQVGVYLETLLDEYPTQTNDPLPLIHTWTSSAGNTITSGFASEASQRYFFAAMNSGQLEVPYVRTGRLGASMTSFVEWLQGVLYLWYGSNLEYAPLVIGGENEQAAYHEDNWPELPSLLEQHLGDVMVALEQALERLIKRIVG